MRRTTTFLCITVLSAAQSFAADTLAPLTQTPGDVGRGAASVRNREGGHCVLCHAFPGVAERLSGNIGPSLAGVGARLDAAQLRLRVANNAALNPATIMPSYHVEAPPAARNRVASAYVGKPVLAAQEVEDIVAYLASLR